MLVNLGLFLLAFMVLTAEPLRPRDVAVGVVSAAVFWQTLQLIGTWYVTRGLQQASATYGVFAVVITLLSWLYLGSQLTLLAAEINVVLRYRLWPRSVTQPPLTRADRLTLTRLAQWRPAGQSRWSRRPSPERPTGIRWTACPEHGPDSQRAEHQPAGPEPTGNPGRRAQRAGTGDPARTGRPDSPGHPGSVAEQLGLGGRELRIGQRALLVQFASWFSWSIMDDDAAGAAARGPVAAAEPAGACCCCSRSSMRAF